MKTNFTSERGLDFTLVSASSGEEGTTELNFDEELRVEDTRSRVEWSSRDTGVNMIGGSDRVAIIGVRYIVTDPKVIELTKQGGQQPQQG